MAATEKQTVEASILCGVVDRAETRLHDDDLRGEIDAADMAAVMNGGK